MRVHGFSMSEDMKEKLAKIKDKLKDHPGGQNLKPILDSKRASELGRLGALKREENRAERKRIREHLKFFKEEAFEMANEVPDGFTVMKSAMAMAIANGDMDSVLILAKEIAEYERPKLQRQEIDQRVRTSKDLTDEELEELLRLEEELDSERRPN